MNLRDWSETQQHWSIMTPRPEVCFFCKERCPRVVLGFNNGSARRRNCGTWALEFADEHGDVTVVSIEEVSR